MYKRDDRLVSFITIMNDRQFAKYKNAVSANRFGRLQELVDWLYKQAKSALRNQTKVTAEGAPAGLIPEGDLYYLELFDRLELMPRDEDDADEPRPGPLSHAVEEICRMVSGQRTYFKSLPVVYGDLQEMILGELAGRFAADTADHDYAAWLKLIDLFRDSHDFYWRLIDQLPEAIIRAHISELAPDVDPDNIVAHLAQGDRRMEDAAYHQFYLDKLQQFSTAPSAVFINELTDDASTMSLHEDQSFKLTLTGRLGTAAKLHWLQQLYWPLAQAAAMNEFDDLAELEELVAILIRQPAGLQTRDIHLLLMILERWLHVAKDICFNLKSFTGEHYHHDQEAEAKVVAEGRIKYESWKSSGMADTTTRIFQNIGTFGQQANAGLHQGLFGWVSGQDRERWLNHQSRDIILPLLDELRSAWLRLYTSGQLDSTMLLTAIGEEGLNWKKFDLLYPLWESDRNEKFRERLAGQMRAYLLTKPFSWNPANLMDDHYVHQVVHFTKIAFMWTNGRSELEELTHTHRIWHEGWGWQGAGAHANRYYFLLACGIGLAYLYYDQGDTPTATDISIKYAAETIQQYRATTSELDKKRYNWILRLLTFALVRFDPARLGTYLDHIQSQFDQPEDQLDLAHTLWVAAVNHKVAIDRVIRQQTWHTVNRKYWIILARMGQAKNRIELEAYQQCYNKLEPWYTQP